MKNGGISFIFHPSFLIFHFLLVFAFGVEVGVGDGASAH